MLEPNRKPMTTQQRKALHKWCRQVAEALNEAGYMAMTNDPEHQFPWKDGVEIPFTMEIVKENMFKPVLKALSGKDSTEEQNTVDVMDVFEPLNLHFGEKFGIHVPWPSEETMSEEQREGS